MRRKELFGAMSVSKLATYMFLQLIRANERAVAEEFKTAFSFAPSSILTLTLGNMVMNTYK